MPGWKTTPLDRQDNQNGDRSDELFEDFEPAHFQIECSAMIEYTDEAYQQFQQILHDAAEIKSRK